MDLLSRIEDLKKSSTIVQLNAVVQMVVSSRDSLSNADYGNMKSSLRAMYTSHGVATKDMPELLKESIPGHRNRGVHYKQTGGISEAFTPTAPNEHGVSPDSVLLTIGMNKSKTRKYTKEFMESNLSRFDGAVCHADHPSNTEHRDRPERTVRTMAAVVRNPRYQSVIATPEGSTEGIVGDLEYLDTESGRDMKAAYSHPVIREQCGLSIFWPGEVKVRKEKIGEALVSVPLELIGQGKLNVDFVTRPNAGGRVGPLRESEDEDMTHEEMLEALKSERPELLEAYHTPAPEKVGKTPEVKIVQGMSESEKTEFETLRVRARRQDATDIVNQQIVEAAIPEVLAVEIRNDYAMMECTDATSFTAQVKSKIERMKKLGEALTPKPTVHGVHQESFRPADGTINVAEYLKGNPKVEQKV